MLLLILRALSLRNLKLSSTQNKNLLVDPKMKFQMLIKIVRDFTKSRDGCLLIVSAYTQFFSDLKVK